MKTISQLVVVTHTSTVPPSNSIQGRKHDWIYSSMLCFNHFCFDFRCIRDTARVSRVPHIQIFAPLARIANFGLHVEELRQWVGLSGLLVGDGHYHLRYGHVLRREECWWHQFHFHSRCFLVHHRHDDDARVTYYESIYLLVHSKLRLHHYQVQHEQIFFFI